MARLDRLGEAKLVAQLGSAIGREFEYVLLESVALNLTEATLREGLGRLIDAELIYQRGLPPEGDSLPSSTRCCRTLPTQSLAQEPTQGSSWARGGRASRPCFPKRVAQRTRGTRTITARRRDRSRFSAISHYQEAGWRGRRSASSHGRRGRLAHLQRGDRSAGQNFRIKRGPQSERELAAADHDWAPRVCKHVKTWA